MKWKLQQSICLIGATILVTLSLRTLVAFGKGIEGFSTVTVADETFRIPNIYNPVFDKENHDYVVFDLTMSDVDRPPSFRPPGLSDTARSAFTSDSVSVSLDKTNHTGNAFQTPPEDLPVFKGHQITLVREKIEEGAVSKGVEYLGTLRHTSYFYSKQTLKYFSCNETGYVANPLCEARFALDDANIIQVRITVNKKHIDDMSTIIDGVVRIIGETKIEKGR